MRFFLTFLYIIIFSFTISASSILIKMNNNQTNHLKAYGIAFWSIENFGQIKWLLNYEGGSFLIPYNSIIEKECIIRDVSFEMISDNDVQLILNNISSPSINQESIDLDKTPKIAVYTPLNKQPWDDAVTLVLEYAEIPYTKIYDSTIVNGGLNEFQWLHLHHEDFTGQYGKFYSSYSKASWYIKQQKLSEENARKLGFNKVSELKLNVAQNIKDFVFKGGYLFTMCSGTDSYDIALSASNIDICASVFDGDGQTSNMNSKLEFNETFAFKNFEIIASPYEYEYSNIDGTKKHLQLEEEEDLFTLFDFSAKWDFIPCMLVQNHTNIIKGFMGQTTSFNDEYIKNNATILGASKFIGTSKYIHGNYGQGTWTFYGGHDPEDYKHLVGDEPTNLELHPNSPGYRLILNNLLFPAAKKKKRKT